MTGLLHCFASGIRFDTDVQYQAIAGNSTRWRNLPLKLHRVDDTHGGLLCALQCAMALTQAARMPSVRGRAPPGDLAQMQTLVERFTAESKPQALQAEGDMEIMTLAQRTVDAGGWSLLHYQRQNPALTRWALVCGVECEENAPNPRALLLLDSQASEPWGTGYNARLFMPEQPDSRHGSISLWRDVWGGSTKVRMLGLLSFVARS